MIKLIFLLLIIDCLFSCESSTQDLGKIDLGKASKLDSSFQSDMISKLDQSIGIEMIGDSHMDMRADLSTSTDHQINLDQAQASDQSIETDARREDQSTGADLASSIDANMNTLTTKPWSTPPDLSQEMVHDLVNHANFGELSYRLYWPSHFNAENHGDVPVLIALHGCLMSPEDMANVTQFNRMAEHLGFAVIYPEQSSLSNLSRCWNWFFTSNQGLDQHQMGEAAKILKIVDDLSTQYPIQKNDLWVAGISAGASMANILATCYHSRVKKVLSVAGVGFALANNLQEAQSVLAGQGQIDANAQARLGYACETATRNAVKAMIVQGRQDQTVHPNNAQKIIEQMVTLNDLLDDGIENQSVSTSQLVNQDHGGMGGHAYHISSLEDQVANASVVLVDVEQMGHAWSGGEAGLAFSDSLGPQVGWWFVADFN